MTGGTSSTCPQAQSPSGPQASSRASTVADRNLKNGWEGGGQNRKEKNDGDHFCRERERKQLELGLHASSKGQGDIQEEDERDHRERQFDADREHRAARCTTAAVAVATFQGAR